MVGERSGGYLVTRGIEGLHEIHRAFVPDGNKPIQTLLFAIGLNLAVLVFSKFDFVTILQVANVAPGGFAHLVFLVRWDSQLRGALLELDRIGASPLGQVD